MAVDGTTSPMNNFPLHNKTPDASEIGSPSDDASRDSANEPEMHADAVSMTSSSAGPIDDPSTTPDCDDQLRSTSKGITSFPLVDGGAGNYSFGESHVTRLESFVESLTGPSYSHRKSTTVRDWTNALSSVSSAAVVPNSTTHRNSRPHDVTGSSLQPLDLSLKAGVCSGPGDYRAKSNIALAPTAASSQLDFPSKPETLAGVSDGLLTTLSAAAAGGFPFGFPGYSGTQADMWLAHWVAMATAAAAASANLFNQIPGLAAAVAGNPLIASSLAAAGGVASQSQSVPRDQRRMSPSMSARRKDVINARSPHSSPSARRTPNAAHSSDVRNHIRSPIQDGAVHTSSPSFARTGHASKGYGVDRRRSEVTSSTPQTGSAFSLYERSPNELIRKDPIGRSNKGSKPAAALSAIESFVENSFGYPITDVAKQRRHLSNGRHLDDVAVHGHHAATKRRYHEDKASSSGDDEPSSRSRDQDHSLYSGSGGRAKKPRHITASGEESYRHQVGGDITDERERGKIRTGASSVEGEAETSTSPDGTAAAGSRSLEYLQCLAYSRPIDSEHPLESLEKLVHVQQRQSSMPAAASPSRRLVVSQSTAAVQQHSTWTPRTRQPSSPYRHDDVMSSQSGDETVNGDQVAVAESTGSPDSHVTSCREDSIVETTTTADDIRDMTSSAAIFSRSPATSVAAAVSLVC